MAIIEIIQTVSMTIATIIYSMKNVKHLTLCFGLIECVQKSNQDEEIKNLEEQIYLLETQLKTTTEHLKRVKSYIKTPREENSKNTEMS